MLKELLFGIDIVAIVGKPFYAFLIFIGFDIITGILRAGKDRELNSSINIEGLITKLGEVVAVVFLSFIDTYLGVDGIILKTGVWLLITYEVMSIIENFKQIGVELNFIMKYFDKNKYKEVDKNE